MSILYILSFFFLMIRRPPRSTPLSLHDALPISKAFNNPTPSTLSAGTRLGRVRWTVCAMLFVATSINYMDRQVIAILKPTLERSEEHTSELQSQSNLVCRLLLEKKIQHVPHICL